MQVDEIRVGRGFVDLRLIVMRRGGRGREGRWECKDRVFGEDS